jgi:hypothetical protein
VLATQARLDRVYAGFNRYDRLIKAAMPDVVGDSRMSARVRTSVMFPAVESVRVSAVERAFGRETLRTFDVARANRPVNVADTVRATLTTQAGAGRCDSVRRGTALGIADTVRAAVKAQTALGIRDIGGAASAASVGRRLATAQSLTAAAGIADLVRGSRSAFEMSDSFRLGHRRSVLDAIQRLSGRPATELNIGRIGGRWTYGGDAWDAYRTSIDRFAETRRELSLFIEAWEHDALWFLLQSLGIGTSRLLGRLSRQEAEEVLFEALEEVVLDGTYTAALSEVVKDHAPHLMRAPRHHLQTFLGHAAEGDWLTAVPPMMDGLEGALHSVARAEQIVTPQGTYIDRPNQKVSSAEAVIKLLPVDDGYELFIVRRIFGGVGDPHRHGTAEDGEREQVLMGIIGLAGWVDEFMQLRAIDRLAREIEQRLPACVERRFDRLEAGAGAQDD